MPRQVLLTVLISSALLMASPLAEAGAGEEQRARARGGNSSGRVGRSGQTPSTSGRGKAVGRRAPGPRGGAIAPGGSTRQGARGPSGRPSRRVRGGSSGVAGAPASAPRRRAGSPPTRGADSTTPKAGRIIRRTPGGTPQTSGAGVASSVPQRRRGRVVEVQGTPENATSKPGATRVGSSARRATGRSTTGRQVSSDGRGRPNQGSGTTTQLSRGQRGRDNVTGRAVPRRPIASSPGYGGRGSRDSAYRTNNSYGYRYPYNGGRARFGRRYTSGYYPHHYYPQRHYRYPGYHRPIAYGSFYYFPGYGFNLGLGHGYQGGFGHYGYSGYAYYPYVDAGYGSTYNYSDLYTGFLRLKVKPRDAQVFVDGYYVGIVDHFDGFAQRLKLEEGTHRIEIRHPQYVPVEFDVLIVPGEKVTFEEYLAPL